MFGHGLGGFLETAPQVSDLALVGTLRSTAAKLVAVLLNLLDVIDNPAAEPLRSQLEVCAAELAATTDPAAIEALAARCLEIGQHALSYLSQRRHEEHQEIASLITLVRETIAAMSGEAKGFGTDIAQSLDRFEAIASVRDIHELKRKLVAEVVTLRKISTEREKAWKKTSTVLEERVATLEQQLAVTERAATVDPLTGAANRGAFDQACAQMLKSGLLKVVLMLIDVDDFKKFNDGFGHAAGDRVLIAVTHALKAGVRSEQDLVARFGGDEFAVLTVGLSLRQAQDRFAAFVAHLADPRNQTADQALPPVHISGGVAEYSAGDTVKSLLQRADEALYEAKRRGKNRVVAKEKPYLKHS